MSQLEIAFDFFPEKLFDLYTFLKEHLYLKYSRTDPYGWYETTFYANNLRKSCKGMRIYIKRLENRRSVRLELLLNREAIRCLGLGFPPALGSLSFLRYFEFKTLSEDRLRNYMIRQKQDQIAESERRRPGFGGLVICQIDSWISSFFGSEESLMGKIAFLKSKKGLPNYWRFLDPVEELNTEFIGRVASQRFLSRARSRMSH